MEDRHINSLHYFARFSFISKCENAKGCNEIEEKIIWLLYLTLREVSWNAGFLWSVFSHIWTESYDSVHTRENTDQRKPTFRDISRTVKVKNFIRSSTLIRRWYIWYIWYINTVYMIVSFNFKYFHNSKTVKIQSRMTKTSSIFSRGHPPICFFPTLFILGIHIPQFQFLLFF